MPRMVTEVVAGVVMYGDFIASGYVPAEDQSDKGEKYYVQITAPNLNSYKVRLTDAAWAQFCALGSARMGMPVMMDVQPMVFNGQQYWRGESFFVRSDPYQPFTRSSAPAGPSGAGTETPSGSSSSAGSSSASASGAGGKK